MLNVVSLYTGAGGLDWGFEAAGFKTKVAIEMDYDCCKTMEANTNWEIIQENIHKVSTTEIIEKAGLKKSEIDVLIGGPPCQPFSKSGYWVNGDTKRLNDPRAETLKAFMNLVEEYQPTSFLIENVHGINYSGKEEGFKFIYESIKKINESKGTNYSYSWKVLNAADFGVPQIRVRFFLIAHRDGKKFIFPEPTHKPIEEKFLQNNFGKIIPTYTTSWDAIGDIPINDDEDLEAKGQWADLLPSIPEGKNYLWHTERGSGQPIFKWRSRYWSFLLKLAKNRPSWTIQAQPGPAIGPFHWKSRRLSVKELAALQTFPRNMTFKGKRGSIQKQIGNAVPSLMGEVLAREIGRQFFDKKYPRKLKYEVKLNRPIPSPEPIEKVPEKYLHLIGDHPDHP